jgi:hypothetical protein
MRRLTPVRSPGHAPTMTPLQRWRSRRNAVIALASEHGASQRLLGEAFTMSPSVISDVLKSFRAKAKVTHHEESTVEQHGA